MSPYLFLLEVTTKITPSDPGAAAATADAAATAATNVSWTARLMQNPAMVVVVYCVILFAAMYFFSIRPTKKREQKMAQIRESIQVGDNVILNSGMFGKIADITAECFVIEFGTNKGVRIPVLKHEVFGKREPNLTNKVEEVAPPPKRGLFGRKPAEDTQTKEKE